LQEVGEILHLANSGRVIVRLSKVVQQDQILCDENSTKVAKVTELIGPVAKPYASAISLTNNVKKFVGKKMFTFEIPSAKKHNENRRKRKWKR
jgi:RNA-binding protein